MTSHLPADKPREFHCDACGARCTRSAETDKEYGHAYHCPRRGELGMYQPPRYSGAIATQPDDGWACPSCDYECGHRYALHSHHTREHGQRASLTECTRCGVRIALAVRGSNDPRCLPCYAATDRHPEMVAADPDAAPKVATDGGERDA